MATSTPWSPICARCRRRSDAPAHGNANTSFAPAGLPAHDVVNVGRREIIGDDVARGAVCARRVHAPRQELRQRKAKAVINSVASGQGKSTSCGCHGLGRPRCSEQSGPLSPQVLFDASSAREHQHEDEDGGDNRGLQIQRQREPPFDIRSRMHQWTTIDRLMKSLAALAVGHLASIEIEHENPNCR
jgi:hypothetical protein